MSVSLLIRPMSVPTISHSQSSIAIERMARANRPALSLRRGTHVVVVHFFGMERLVVVYIPSAPSVP
jgi:hypothetical protein